jgi:type II secretory pathway pseudopilin PulG
MLAALIAVVIASTIVVISLVGALDRQRRSADRRADLLINQIMHLSGQTWQEPPRPIETLPMPDEPTLLLTASPEQLA